MATIIRRVIGKVRNRGDSNLLRGDKVRIVWNRNSRGFARTNADQNVLSSDPRRLALIRGGLFSPGSQLLREAIAVFTRDDERLDHVRLFEVAIEPV